jgi:hypothetical protein
MAVETRDLEYALRGLSHDCCVEIPVYEWRSGSDLQALLGYLRSRLRSSTVAQVNLRIVPRRTSAESFRIEVAAGGGENTMDPDPDGGEALPARAA